MCIAVELNSRPTIRVVSRLYSKRTKPCPTANEKALTSWSNRSNRSNQFPRRAGFYLPKWRASGMQLAAKTKHSKCPFRSLRTFQNDACGSKICNLLPGCDFYLKESIHHCRVKECHAFWCWSTTNVVQNKHFVICFIMAFREMWADFKNIRDFFLVKLKDHLYIRQDGVLNVFLN